MIELTTVYAAVTGAESYTMTAHIAYSMSPLTSVRALTNLAKRNSPSFPGFPDPLNSLFHTVLKLKPDVTNHFSSHFGTFLAELQNIF